MAMSKEEKAQFDAMMATLKTLQEEKATLQAALAAKSTQSKLSDPAYRKLCHDLKAQFEKLAIEKGATLAHVFTISDKVLPHYKHPVTLAEWHSRGKMPSWLSSMSEEQRAKCLVPANGAAH